MHGRGVGNPRIRFQVADGAIGKTLNSLHEVAYWPDYGYVLCGDVKDAAHWLCDMHCRPAVTIADPPYGDILSEKWDRADVDAWIALVSSLEMFETPIYFWGGTGKIKHRPFFEFILRVEQETNYSLRDLITWKKVRAFGKAKDYLYVREECAYLTLHGEVPLTFHVPYLSEKRGYAGFNEKYPAKSEYKRRGNVWVETELLRDKVHPAQKAPIVCRIPIEVHTQERDLVLDLYSGSGETSFQAIHLNRSFVAIERDLDTACNIAKRLESKIQTESQVQ